LTLPSWLLRELKADDTEKLSNSDIRLPAGYRVVVVVVVVVVVGVVVVMIEAAM